MYYIILLSSLLPFTSTMADICSYCACDISTKSVTCQSASLLLRTVSLLPYVERLYLKGLILPHAPHILFHSGLRVLRINECGLEEMNQHVLLSVPNLEVLDVSNNRLKTLPSTLLRSLKHLKVVNLAGNQISDLSSLSWILGDNIVLEQLDLSRNPISISTRNTFLPPTRQLFLSDVNLQSLNSSTGLFMPSKACHQQHCRTFNLQNFVDVEYLTTIIISRNSELEIDISAFNLFQNISYFGLSDVNLPNGFGKWLEERSGVRNLNISHSTILLPDETWEWCGSQLDTLDISGIKMSKLILKEDCEVKVVHAKDNLLETIQLQAHSIEALYLEGNILTDWPILMPGVILKHLKSLSLSRNILTSLPANSLTQFPSLQHLDISRNQIAHVDRLAFPSVGMQLISLDISHNQLTILPHPILPSLLYLDASSNKLTTIDPILFAGLPLLQHLQLSHNVDIFTHCTSDCWSDSLDQLTGLLDLDLSDCALSRSLPLSHLSSLRTLLLRRNRILDVDASDLPKSVQTLDLGDNRIHYTSNFSHLEALRDLRVDNNPLRCHCSLHDIVPHLKNQSQISDSELYYCYSGSWQYPLLPYLVSVGPCASTKTSFIPMLLSTFAFSLLVILCILLSFLIYKKYAHVFSHAYKRLATDISPVRL